MSRRISYSEVYAVFEKAGCILLSDKYIRAKDKLDYICGCGSISEISYDKFSQGQRCYRCRTAKTASKQRHSYEKVKQTFEGAGCELISKSYSSNKEKLEYRCICGDVAFISYSKFAAGQRCQKCKIEKMAAKASGPNSHRWKDGRSQDQRYKDRSYPEYKKWRRDVFNRDDYTCQRCEVRGSELQAHHISSFANHEHLRTELSNGITLCKDCHKEYHNAFGVNNANPLDLESFLHGEYNELINPFFAGEAVNDENTKDYY